MGNELYTGYKIFHHHQALKALAEGRRIAPIHVRLKPTNFCNHHCNYCTYGTGGASRPTDNRDLVWTKDTIPREKMLELARDLAKMGVRAVTFSGGGEPLTYPHLAEAVEFLRESGVELSLISNGQLLSSSLADLFASAKWVRISFDSPRAEEYAALRNVPTSSFDTVCRNLADFAARKNSDCVLGVNFVVGLDNFERIYEAAAFLKNLGAENVKFSGLTANEKEYHKPIRQEAIHQIQAAQNELSTSFFTVIDAYSNVCEDANFYPPTVQKCYLGQVSAAVGADCNVYACHTRAYDSKAVLGSIKDCSFQDLWFDRAVAAKAAELNPARDCLNLCVYDKYNRALDGYFNVNLSHVNFL